MIHHPDQWCPDCRPDLAGTARQPAAGSPAATGHPDVPERCGRPMKRLQLVSVAGRRRPPTVPPEAYRPSGHVILWPDGQRPAEATTGPEHITHPVVNGHRVVTLRDNGQGGTD